MHDWTRMVEVDCEQCGDSFERKKAVEEQSDHSFCSRDCQGKWQSETFSGEDSHEWKGGPSEYACEQCGETFEAYSSNSNDNRYCSRECQVDAREYPSGENHPNWNPDYEWWPHYGGNWETQRRKALDRDGRCQVCEIHNVAYRALVGRNLDVHHIVPFEEFDNHEEANHLDNLMALCAGCHNLVERTT